MNKPFLAHAFAAAALALATSNAAQAADYPDKAVRLVVPWPAGGAADAVGRSVAQALTTELGQSVFVENIAGAGGNIGTTNFVRSSKPDGYSLYLATSSTNVANPYLYAKTGFDPVKDFVPVISIAVIPSILVVPENSPFKTPKDLIDAAKEKPDSLSYGSGGVGASAHLAGELFKSVTKIKVAHIPYKGSGPAITDVMAGQLSYMFDTGAISYIKGGKVRPLAVAASRRVSLLPDVPTFDELGIKGMYMSAWYGVAAPAGTPDAIVQRVNAALNKALKSGPLSQQIVNLGGEVKGGTSASFSSFWKSELTRYEGLVTLTGAKLE